MKFIAVLTKTKDPAKRQAFLDKLNARDEEKKRAEQTPAQDQQGAQDQTDQTDSPEACCHE